MADEPICLTSDEIQALRQLLGMLAEMDRYIGPSAKYGGLPMLEISQQMWRDMVLRPAAGLRRVTVPKIEPSGG